MSAPVAVASIRLSEEQRTRIAADLGLGPDELDAVPTEIGLARFETEDAGGGEVAGFAATPGALPAIGTISIAGIGATSKFGRLPGSILIPF